jgi:hypothetical protein
MKAHILVFSLIFAAGALQAAAVIQNGEDALLYYSTMPFRPGASDTLGDDPGRLLAYVRDNSRTFDCMPPRGARELSSKDGALLLIGVFVFPGLDSAPVIAMKLPATADRQTFTASKAYAVMKGDKSPLAVQVWDLALPASAIQLDNRYLDWLKVPELARFAPAFTPMVFTRESRGQREAVRIEDSLYWHKGGTQLESIKALIEKNSLNIMLSTTTEMADGLSFYFYAFRDRLQASLAAYSVEIPVHGAWGPVLLWKKGENKPGVIGEFVKSQFYLEARLDLASLPADPAPDGGIDVASCFFGGGAVEEFDFTTINVRDIPVR